MQSIRVESIDASAVTSGIDEAVQAAQTPVEPTVDAGPITAGIDEAVAAATPPPVPVEPDTGGIADSIDSAVSGATPPPLEVPVDAESITSSIDTALSSVDTSGLQSELDSAAGSASQLSGSAKDAASNVGLLAPSAALATGEVSGLRDVVDNISPGMAAAAAATFGLAEAGKTLFDRALEQNTALARLREEFGADAEAVQQFQIGGLNTDLEHLSIQTGANVDGLRNFAASFAQLGHSAGASEIDIMNTAQAVQALALRASVLNPNLGTADEIVQRLSTSLARGGRFLSLYGIALSTAQINAEALRETGKTTAAELSIYDKITAGATLATQQLGNALGRDINEGSQKAVVQLRSLKAAFEETLKAAGRPLIEPTIEAFRELEPILEALARVLGVGLSAALRIVGPLLAGLAAVLKPIADAASEIPAPVVEAATAFFLFSRLAPILIDAGAALVDFVVATVTQFGALQASAVETAAVTDAAMASIATSAETAAVAPAAEGVAVALGAAATTVALVAAGAALLGFAYARLTDDSATLNAGTGDLKKNFADINVTMDESVTKFSQTQFAAGAAAGALQITGLNAEEIGKLAASGNEGYRKFLDTLVAGREISRAAADELLRTGESASELRRQINTGQTGIHGMDDDALHLIDTFQRVQSTTRDTAHEVLTAAVAHGQLSRAEEVTAIQAHTARDGHVDWIAVLTELKPKLEGAKAAADQFGAGAAVLNPKVQEAADTQKKFKDALDQAGRGMEANLVKSGQFTQAQVDTANALSTDKNGATDYKAALDLLQPGLGETATASGQLAGGLDTTAQKFALAQAGAKAYQTAIDELLAPLLDASNADVAWHRALDSLNDTLLKNGNTIDLNTKKGQDNVAQINATVAAGTTAIDKLIAEGAATDVVTGKKAEVIAKLKEEEVHYPALTPLIEGYIDKINAIPVSHPTDVGLPNAPAAGAAADDVRSRITAIPQNWPVTISADATQATAVIDDVSVSFKTLKSVIESSPIQIKIDGKSIPQQLPNGASVVISNSAMAGGTFGPWEPVLVGERGAEVVTFPRDFTVHPHGESGGSTITQNVTVNEVAQDPEATAFSVATKLGDQASR